VKQCYNSLKTNTLVNLIRLKHHRVPLLRGSSFLLKLLTWTYQEALLTGRQGYVPEESLTSYAVLDEAEVSGMLLLLVLTSHTHPFTAGHHAARGFLDATDGADKRVLLRHVSRENICRWRRLVQASIRTGSRTRRSYSHNSTTSRLSRNRTYSNISYHNQSVPSTTPGCSSRSKSTLPTQYEDHYCYHRDPPVVGHGERMERTRTRTRTSSLPRLCSCTRSHRRISARVLRWMASS
jgi:hypothetical protein